MVQVLKVRLGQRPSFPVMEDGVPCARALQMAKGLARGVTFKAVYFKSCSIFLKRHIYLKPGRICSFIVVVKVYYVIRLKSLYGQIYSFFLGGGGGGGGIYPTHFHYT